MKWIAGIVFWAIASLFIAYGALFAVGETVEHFTVSDQQER